MSIVANNICIIPARGGSKRIPRKNIKNFLGKPIIAYSIAAARESGLFSKIIVSTDDKEIADVAIRYGAEVPFFRSQDTSNEYATLSEVIEEVKVFYNKQDIKYDYICCVLATAPFITPKLIKEAYQKLIKSDFDSVRPIVRFSYPIQRGLKLVNDSVSYLYPEYSKTRSQDLEPIYYDAGMFYWMTFEKGLNGNNKSGIVIPDKNAQDIDTLEDWEVAEIKYKIIFESF